MDYLFIRESDEDKYVLSDEFIAAYIVEQNTYL